MIPHGGDLSRLRQRFPDAPEPLIDLSTGINPYSYPVPAIPETAYTRLPEQVQIRQLKESAAAAYGASEPDTIAAAPGTQLLISILPRILPAAQVAILSPTYGEHAAVWSAAGAAVLEGAGPEVLESGEVAVLCNPNNPDGRALAPREIEALQTRRLRRGGRLIVDEAFAEFGEAHLSAVPAVPQPGLIVLRSFGKAFGLAGVRLGFLVAERGIVRRVEEALGPWPVSGIAIHLACTALRDTAWRQATTERLAQTGERLASLLSAHGLEPVGGTSLFRLVRHDTAPAIAGTLGRAGILVREFPERPDWLRFGLPPDEAAWTRLENALAAAR
ncbi:MAG: threonine-phosphate decarboxylase CobD [Rhodospirillaceae bacterium]|nr:threonine-phosphate decarboxylase CobD [Rhodospirillaceae bacterium]